MHKHIALNQINAIIRWNIQRLKNYAINDKRIDCDDFLFSLLFFLQLRSFFFTSLSIFIIILFCYFPHSFDASQIFLLFPSIITRYRTENLFLTFIYSSNNDFLEMLREKNENENCMNEQNQLVFSENKAKKSGERVEEKESNAEASRFKWWKSENSKRINERIDQQNERKSKRKWNSKIEMETQARKYYSNNSNCLERQKTQIKSILNYLSFLPKWNPSQFQFLFFSLSTFRLSFHAELKIAKHETKRKKIENEIFAASVSTFQQ